MARYVSKRSSCASSVAVARRDANASMNASWRAASWVTKSSDPTVLLPKRVVSTRGARRRTPY